ncbi:beta-ketoacyl-ACP synthase 3 [Thermobifida alba]|uniref:Beta-ketoacyl-ACP synthase 3 n=1 Tax=Thermobifida alba TaxID=53522 RepID=A0ABY4L2X2_THEAE|nr:beta-ketoacyl-ACP synthase 3 [Thermobifida alba]UPT20828.1 beta-ketoacyl-ACP synthase 3 [Thermobifida alba]
MIRQTGAGTGRHAAILGVGGYRPRRVVSNIEVCAGIDSTPEWIESRSGIRERRFADERETLAMMAAQASATALAGAGLRPEAVDLLLAASMSDLVQTPPLAARASHALGAHAAAAVDVSGACAGFCHALAAARDAVLTGSAEYVVVVAAERMTDIVDPADRNVSVLFADGAGAVVVGPSAVAGVGPVVRRADVRYTDALRMSGDWGRYAASLEEERPWMRMDGRRVFQWVADAVVRGGREVIRASGIEPADLEVFIPHQANERLIDLLAERLGLSPTTVVARDVVTSGNTSAASIPLAMETLLASGGARSGQLALLLGFGAGLNFAGQVVRLP